MIETGKANTALGKMILAACFVNDLGTVIALGVLFAGFNLYLLAFVVITAVVMFLCRASQDTLLQNAANKGSASRG
jgi:hypothetical protein